MEHLKIYTLTWNTNGQIPPVDLDCRKLLGLPQEAYSAKPEHPDIYVLGFQELSLRPDNMFFDTLLYAEDAWTRACRNVLKRLDYVKIRSQRLMGFSISVFVKKQHLLYVRDIESQYTRLSMAISGFKGAVSVRMNIYGVSFCFVNSHLCAHDHLLPTRIMEYNTIIESQNFLQEHTTKILYHDYIFWMGDLNFRLAEGTFNHDEIVKAVENGEYAKLLAKDQLTQARKEETAFHELSEKLPSFPPTYKFTIGTDQYNKKRRPAWTDRILFRVNSYNYEDQNVELALEAADYKSHNDKIYRCSDHLPVSQEFTVAVFGQSLGKKKKVDAFGPMIKFHRFHEPWYVNEDRQFSYDLETGAGRFLSTWDWIGLYRENFTSLDDYQGYCWASNCRRTTESKSVWLDDTVVTLAGRFVLVYVSARSSILGMSEPFEVLLGESIEVAREVHEHDE